MTNMKKYIVFILGMVLLSILLIGGTFAYFTFSASVTNGEYSGIIDCMIIEYDVTNDDGTMPISGTLFQSSTPKGGLVGNVAINIDSTCDFDNALGTINLNINDSTSSLLLSEGALKYAVYDNIDNDPVSFGVITSTGVLPIYAGFNVTQTLKKYHIYIWLDGNIADNEYVNLSFSGYIDAYVVQTDFEYLEYIQSSGTQYIDTGVSVTPNTMITLDAAFLEGTHGGETYVSSQDYNFIGSYGSKTGLALASYNGKLRFWNSAPQTQVYDYSFDTRYRIILNNNGVYSVNGTNVDLTEYSVTENLNSIYIFAAQYSGDVGSPFKPGSMKFYGASIYENGNIVRNFVPIRTVNGMVGLFDLITGSFYSNAGTGAFIAGPKIDKNDDSSSDSGADGANVPVLDDGMIPVKIANNGTVTTVAETDPSWYSYDNKEWANAVLVKESGTQLRSYYKNNPNITIPEEDILAYYVWIPRYKYKIWTTSIGSSPQSINIEFESKTAEPVLGTTVDSWKTHPAFIWDGETVAGIWVGKFETGHSTLSSSTTKNKLSCTDENCANADGIIIKPNVVSLRRNKISNQFYASRSMSRSGNPFGLSASSTDMHMMKNSEWGAVAYLSHSKYGINEEIRINNNSSYTTGCGASAENGSSNSLCQIAYGGATSYPQSTTGNITGVFDISGGAEEYVMGNYNNTIGSAGFSTMPSSKYYDTYSSIQFTGDYSTNMSLCTIETCGGHALFETAGWYSDYQYFVRSVTPWFLRGVAHDNGSGAGACSSSMYGGEADASSSFRSVAIVGA